MSCALPTGTPHQMAPEVRTDEGAVAELAAAVTPGPAFLRSPLDFEQPRAPGHNPTVVQEVAPIPQLLQQYLPFLTGGFEAEHRGDVRVSFVDLQVARQLDLRLPAHQAEVLPLMDAGLVLGFVPVLRRLCRGTEGAFERVL